MQGIVARVGGNPHAKNGGGFGRKLQECEAESGGIPRSISKNKNRQLQATGALSHFGNSSDRKLLISPFTSRVEAYIGNCLRKRVEQAFRPA